MKISIFAQLRRGANPLSNLPDGYRSAEKSKIELVEPRDGDAQGVRICSGALLMSCHLKPTETLVGDGQWRLLECPDIADEKHISRIARIEANGTRVRESRPWEHRALIAEKDWQRFLAKVEAAKNPQAKTVSAANPREKFFQPCRVQVASHKVSTYGRREEHAILIVNMLTHQAAEVYDRKNSQWSTNIQPGHWEEIQSPHEFTSKGDAVSTAKKLAQARQLPFDENVDVVQWIDALKGSFQRCVACGTETEQRSSEPIVCANCQRLLDLGRHADEKRVVVEVATERLWDGACLPSYDEQGHRIEWDEFQARLLNELLGLCGVRLPERGEPVVRYDHDDIKFRLAHIGDSGFGTIRSARLKVTKTQFERLSEIRQMIADLIAAASVNGLQEGSSLLRSIATGHITVDAFDKGVIDQAHQMQRKARVKSKVKAVVTENDDEEDEE